MFSVILGSSARCNVCCFSDTFGCVKTTLVELVYSFKTRVISSFIEGNADVVKQERQLL